MFKNISALMLLLVMATVITLKHPVLGYCLCLDSYFTSNCVCEQAKPNESSSVKETSCHDCCLAASENENTSNPQEPCDDCTQILVVDVGDFVWDSSTDIPQAGEYFIQPHFSHDSLTHLALCMSRGVHDTRAGPQWATMLASFPPLYLKHSVMRL